LDTIGDRHLLRAQHDGAGRRGLRHLSEKHDWDFAMKKATVSTPCRVDLAGGTVDLWPIYLYMGGLELVNMGIDVVATTELTWKPSKSGHRISVSSSDVNYENEYGSLDELSESLNVSTTFNPLRWVNRLAYYYLSSQKSEGDWHIRTSS